MIDRRKHRVPTERHKKVAAELLAGAEIQKTMLANGYSPNTARMGLAGVPQAVFAIMPRESYLLELGAIKPDAQEQLVRGRLVYNTLVGKDSGVLSAKALGSDRRVNMFQPENMSGTIIINTPAQLNQLLNPAESDE